MVVKELRTRMRNRRSWAVVTFYAAVLGAILIIFLIQHGAPTTGQSSQLGVQLFQAWAIAQLVLILFVTPVSLAGVISGERHRQTWDLLLVTRWSSFEIIWGKLLAGLAFNVGLIFASLPLLGAVFLFGGVSLADLLRICAVYLATILLLGVASLFVSVLTSRPVVSVIVSSAVSVLLGIGLSLAILTVEAGSLIGNASDLGDFTSLVSQMPALTPVAQIDPLAALLSVLPDGHDGTLLGNLGSIHHAFGLPLRLPLWQAFGLLTLAITVLLLAVSSFLLRAGSRRLNSAAS
jgi:ABC-type transport system involved in multi-copper enzyme maturation permease subunit